MHAELRLIGLIAALLVPAAGWSEDAAPRNPFTRPALETPTPAAAPRETLVRRAAPPRLHLRATLLNGDQPMANIDGELLRLGDTIAAYRLIKVESRQVILEKDRQTMILKLENP